jgi:similarities with tail fiber protein
MIYEKPKNEIFASDAKDGEIVEFPNIKRGWGVTENLGFIPPMEYFNAAFNRVDKSLAYQLQRGVGEWDKDMEYPIGAVVSLSGVIYIAKSQNTNKNPANEATIWDIVATQKWSENQLMEREFQCSKAQNGYTKLPNGLIFQWGSITGGGVAGERAFPIAFPNMVLAVIAGNADAQGNVVDNAFAYVISKEKFYYGTKSSYGSAYGSAVNAFPGSYIAIGY